MKEKDDLGWVEKASTKEIKTYISSIENDLLACNRKLKRERKKVRTAETELKKWKN